MPTRKSRRGNRCMRFIPTPRGWRRSKRERGCTQRHADAHRCRVPVRAACFLDSFMGFLHRLSQIRLSGTNAETEANRCMGFSRIPVRPRSPCQVIPAQSRTRSCRTRPGIGPRRDSRANRCMGFFRGRSHTRLTGARGGREANRCMGFLRAHAILLATQQVHGVLSTLGANTACAAAGRLRSGRGRGTARAPEPWPATGRIERVCIVRLECCLLG